MDFSLPYDSRRQPLLARDVVTTSQPLAAQAGLAALAAGGNAVDAAIASAITLTVVEPTGNGIGSDAFALVWDGNELSGLNGSGRSPRRWTAERFGSGGVPSRGWDSVTVPGAVSAWVELSGRFGRLEFPQLFAAGIHYARHGFPVSPHVARLWALSEESLGGFTEWARTFLPNGRAPRPGEIFRNPDQARTLESIAASGGEAFYRGELAEAMAADARRSGALLDEEDLAGHQAEWVQPLQVSFAGVELHELPPNGQGLAALIALGVLERLGVGEHSPDSADGIHLQIEAMKLGLADARRYVADPDSLDLDPRALLQDAYLDERARAVDMRRAGDPGHGRPSGADTVYLAAADSDGMMVSFIQSNYRGFGSGVVVPGTGISLQNRGEGFVTAPGHPNSVGGGKRPFHTIIPGFVSKGGRALMSFGVMGGPMQPQGHVQMLVRTVVHGQNPQAASDAPRWQVFTGREVGVEAGVPEKVRAELLERGHLLTSTPAERSFAFGGAQLIWRAADTYVAGSDWRKDGQAVGF